MNIGENIKSQRKKIGKSQEWLANKAGLSRNAIYNYENNRRAPSIETLTKISEALGCDFSTLVNDTGDFLNVLVGGDDKIIKMYEDIRNNSKESAALLSSLIQTIIKQDNEIFLKYHKFFEGSPIEYLNISFIEDIPTVLNYLYSMGVANAVISLIRSMLKTANATYTKDMLIAKSCQEEGN